MFLGQNYENQRKQKRTLKIRSYEQLELNFTKVRNKTNLCNIRSLRINQNGFIRHVSSALSCLSLCAWDSSLGYLAAEACICNPGLQPPSQHLIPKHLRQEVLDVWPATAHQAPVAHGAPQLRRHCCHYRQAGTMLHRKPVSEEALPESMPLLSVSWCIYIYMICMILVIIIFMHDEYFINIFIAVWRCVVGFLHLSK